VYTDEARELLEELERALLALEADPLDGERIGACFRAMHTIKGGAGMFGFEEIARFTHDVETVFDRVRSGQLPVTEGLLTLTLRARDHILALLDAPPGEVPDELRGASDALLLEFRNYLPEPSPGSPSPQASGPAQQAPSPSAAGNGQDQLQELLPGAPACINCKDDPSGICWVRFRPDPGMLATGNDPLRLLAELDDLGLMRVRRGGPLPPPLGEADSNAELVYGYFDALILTQCDDNAIRDVFIFVEDSCGLKIVCVHDQRMRASDLEELLALIAGIDDDEEAGKRLAGGVAALHERIQEAKGKARAEEALDRARAAAKGAGAGTGAARRGESGGGASLRVDSVKLDQLVDMAGEMVILQSRLRQAVKGGNMEAVAGVDEDLERLTDNMRDLTLGLRMLPIGTVFSTFQRLVRDLGQTLAKEADFVTLGGETELDKTILDQLKDPLVHIIRNSLDHGLEIPDEREAAGKPRRGTITLAASQGGGFVTVEVSDDGRGIDTEAVRRKAVERGLLAEGADLPERELLALVFQPGFSTANKISDVSGRGVGMDVVMRNITDLRGTVELESVKGQGSRVVIRLPLTLAIIDGFNVVVGAESFIVPLSHLRGFQERMVEGPVRTVETMERMGEMISLVSLRRLLDVPGEQPGYERIVITEVDGEKVGFCVDRVVGRQQAVIKSLDDCYRDVAWVSGTTINGDGSISLILDVPRLIRLVRSNA
jgi:two-component system chemotaxis sensor kinase CheA